MSRNLITKYKSMRLQYGYRIKDSMKRKNPRNRRFPSLLWPHYIIHVPSPEAFIWTWQRSPSHQGGQNLYATSPSCVLAMCRKGWLYAPQEKHCCTLSHHLSLAGRYINYIISNHVCDVWSVCWGIFGPCTLPNAAATCVISCNINGTWWRAAFHGAILVKSCQIHLNEARNHEAR